MATLTFEQYVDQNAGQLSASLTAFQQQETPRGFIDSTENGKLLIKALNDNGLAPTVENLVACAKAHSPEKGYRMYYSPQEMAFHAAAASFTNQDIQTLEAWLPTQKGLDASPKCKIAILEQMRGRAFNARNLSEAVGRCIYNGRIPAIYQSTYQPGLHSGKYNEHAMDVPASEVTDCFGKPIVQQTHKLSQQAQAYLDQQAEQARRQPESAKSEVFWKNKMEDLQTQFNTHSQRAVLRAIVVTKPDGSTDFEKTCQELTRVIAAQGSK